MHLWALWLEYAHAYLLGRKAAATAAILRRSSCRSRWRAEWLSQGRGHLSCVARVNITHTRPAGWPDDAALGSHTSITLPVFCIGFGCVLLVPPRSKFDVDGGPCVRGRNWQWRKETMTRMQPLLSRSFASPSPTCRGQPAYPGRISRLHRLRRRPFSSCCFWYQREVCKPQGWHQGSLPLPNPEP